MRPQPGIDVERDEHGIPHVRTASLADAWWGLGYCHARDRPLQILLMRILGRGTASEHLEATEDALRLDRYFRRMGWALTGEGRDPLAGVDGASAAACRAYVAGINFRLFDERGGRAPWELRLLGYRPEPWSVADTLLLTRMVGYLTLAQSQGEIERLLVEMVQAGIPRPRLEELFPGLLDGLDEDLVRQVRLEERLVPAALTWGTAAPRLLASNNWVVAGTRTASGRPILASDPHLETNRLPNVWYEAVLEVDGRYAAGATMPGLPGTLIGRNADVAWGATYSFMDAVDSWIEDCRDGCYRRGERWVRFRVRRESIRRKGREDVPVVFHENEHGVLDGEPDGYRLATRWASAEAGPASVERAFRLFDVRDAAEALEQLGGIELSFNWVAADRTGHVGYQMSGLCPRRREGARGLVPLPGWDPANDWQGWVAAADLPRAFDPPQAFFATANEDLNAHGRLHPITVAMAPYRAERIRELLSEAREVTPEQVAAMHFDVLSLQARRFLEVLRPLLPDTEPGRILRDWDLRYAPHSRGAWLFERFYRELLREVFGRGGLGPAVCEFLTGETGILTGFFGCFDRVLLAPRSEWLGNEERDAVWRRVAARSLAVTPRPWGAAQQMRMRHLLFGGRLPRWLGFDRGPITVPGGRATVHQAQLYRAHGRETSFVASFRMVADMAEPGLRTSLAGGPSDRRFSRWYCSDLAAWQAGRYKRIVPRLATRASRSSPGC